MGKIKLYNCLCMDENGNEVIEPVSAHSVEQAENYLVNVKNLLPIDIECSIGNYVTE